ncbi:Superfamily II DNA and RNA helicase, partial [Giardia duodenalis]
VHIAASSKRCPGKTLRPYEELQPGRAAHVMPSTALRCAVSKGRGGTRARQGPVCGHARTCCCTRCRTPCATRRPVSTAPSSTFTT